jgi:hypothetical protein
MKKTLKTPPKKDVQKLQIKEEIMAVAASLALGMLAMTPGLIAGSALTESANQVPNVGTQVSTAYCAYKSGLDGDRFKECMIDFWTPVSVATIISAPDLPSRIWATLRLGFQAVVRSPAFKVAVTAVA